ncbi:hypothetical protein HHK36_002656 [Tetracentron sinense]|uniref:WPP domain-containing protein n=1 Tax=Tetracentron sinense TaxID=13715 RepID=A0A835DRB1_TETSI|nr:hypothetical protein HHK36_002656 [Tetracentron sinense]
MSEKEEASGVAVQGLEEKAKMAEAEQQQEHEIKKEEKMNISFSIWPPSQRTRDAVITRLVETLTAPSVLSKRYGSMPSDEASAAAHHIEKDAFSAAAASASASGTAEEDGIEILQVYSKEISKRMLEAVKARAASGSSPDDASQTPVAAPATSEEISSVETESS